jgi:hypothetical protein
MFREYEDLFPKKNKFPAAVPWKKYDFSWRNKSSYFTHHHAINVNYSLSQVIDSITF